MMARTNLDNHQSACISCHGQTSPLDDPMQELGCGHFIHKKCLLEKIQAAKDPSLGQSVARLLHFSGDPMTCPTCENNTPICRRKIRPSHIHRDDVRSSIAKSLRNIQQYIEADIIEGKAVTQASARSPELRLDLTNQTVANQLDEVKTYHAYLDLFQGVVDRDTINIIAPNIHSIEFARPEFTEVDDHKYNVAETTCFINLMRELAKFKRVEKVAVDLTESSRFHFIESFHDLSHVAKLPTNLKTISLRFRDPPPDYHDQTKFHDFEFYLEELATNIKKRAKEEGSTLQLKLINAQTETPLQLKDFQEHGSSSSDKSAASSLHAQLAIYATMLLTPAVLTLSILAYAAYQVGQWGLCIPDASESA